MPDSTSEPDTVALAVLTVPVNVGLTDRTTEPEPVDVVAPVPPFTTGRTPDTAVVRLSPVALARLTADGVPRLGVTKVGLLDKTVDPDPVEVVVPVPPFTTGRTPDTWVVNPTLPKDGAVATPPDNRTFPVATAANLDRAELEEA